MTLSLLEQLKQSALGVWLSSSMAGAPTLIALHSVGMAAVVGLSLMVTLRLYSVITGFDLALIPRLLTVAAWGFTLNLVTGLGIFITRGPEYIGSGVFLLKMLLVLISAGTTFWLGRRLTLRLRAGAEVVDSLAKTAAVAATTTWFAAVIAGRMIAYLSDLY